MRYKLFKKFIVPLIALFLLFGTVKATTTLFPSQGGTGTGTTPNTGGKVLISTSGGIYTPAYLTGGTGISIASASGAITITNSGLLPYTGLLMGEGSATAAHITSLVYSPSAFNFSNTASAGNLAIDYTNGPASRSIAQTISGQWAFTASPVGFTVGNSASISTNLEIGGYASIGGNGTTAPAIAIGGNANVAGYSIGIQGGRAMIGYDSVNGALELDGGNSKSIELLVGGTSNTFNTGTNALFIQGSNLAQGQTVGSIGIGTTSPRSHLFVNDGVAGTPTSSSFGIRSSYATGNIASISALGLTTGNAFVLKVPNSGFTGASLLVRDTTLKTLASIGSTGNFELAGYASIGGNLLVNNGKLGIGTTNPTAALQVQGNASVSTNFEVDGTSHFGGAFEIASNASISNNLFVAINSGGLAVASIALGSGNAKMLVQGSGGRTLNLNNTHSEDFFSDRGIEFHSTDQANSNFIDTANTVSEDFDYRFGQLVVGAFTMSSSTSSNFFALTQAGNVGVGTTAPTAKFAVSSNPVEVDLTTTGVNASAELDLFANNSNTQNHWALIAGGLSGVDNDRFQITNNTTQLFSVASNSHVYSNAVTAPTIACGAGSPTVTAGSTDVAGQFVAGAAATSCTLTFAKPWFRAPACTAAVDGATGLALGVQSSTTTVVVAATGLGGDTVSYICLGFGK